MFDNFSVVNFFTRQKSAIPELDNAELEIEIIEAEELRDYFDRIDIDEQVFIHYTLMYQLQYGILWTAYSIQQATYSQNIMEGDHYIDDWGDTAQTNIWSAYMNGITNVPYTYTRPDGGNWYTL